MEAGKTLAIAVTSICLTVSGCATTDDALREGYVTDFESCVADGNPVQETAPRRCLFGGQYFLEGV